MARDETTIANIATGFFGEDDQITSIDEDSKPARTVKAVWDEVRRFVLGAGEWDFAKRVAVLSPRAAHPKWPTTPYAYAFTLPTDFRRFVGILEPECARHRYLIQAGPNGLELLADENAVTIRYIFDLKEPARWSDGFTEAFAMRLAWQIADRLSGDKQRKQQALDAFETALRRARGTDAKQGPPRPLTQGNWSRSRRGGMIDPATGYH